MRAFLTLARLRALEVLRLPSSAAMLFGLPVAFLLLVGLVFADGHPFERRAVALVGDAPALETALAAYPEVHVHKCASLAVALAEVRAHTTSAVVVAAPGGPLRLLVGERDALLGRGLAAALPAPAAVETVAVPARGFAAWVVPGLLAFNVFVAGLFGMGWHMARFRRNGLLRKLATTPLSRASFVAAQIAGRGVPVLVATALVIAVAALAFGLPVTPARAALAVAVAALGLGVFLGFGFVLASLVRTEDTIYDAISAVAWPMVLLSEMFFPVTELPSPLPQVAAALPSTVLVRLLRDVLVLGTTDARALAPGIVTLASWAVGTFVVATMWFRWTEA